MNRKHSGTPRRPERRKKTVVHPRRKRLLSFVGHFIALVILVFASLADNRPPTPENSEEQGYHRILSRNFWYEQTVGKPQKPACDVAVIMLGDNIPEIVEHVLVPGTQSLPRACERRIFIGQLLQGLSKFAPKVVVLDMWFDSKNCPDRDSQVLWDELDRFSSQIPVVSGIGSYNPSEMRSLFPAEFAEAKNRKPGLKSTELVLEPRIEPAHKPNARLTEGVVELNSDYRKIPLSWPVYDDFANVGSPGQPRRVDSLAVAALRAFDPRNQILVKIGALNSVGAAIVSTAYHPYTSFVREEDLSVARAIDVVCSGSDDKSWQDECHTLGIPIRDLRKTFERRIVLVGIGGVREDNHQSLIGSVPGVILHANFIESLLQGRVYEPLAISWQITIGVAWLFVISWITWRFASHPSLAFLFSLLTVIISACLIRWAFAHFHYYADLLVPLILAALVLNATRWIESLLARPEERP
jgi:hypothetical protein